LISRRVTPLILFLAAFATLLSVAAARGRQAPGSPPTPPPGQGTSPETAPPPESVPPPLPPGPAPDLDLVFTNHVVGWIEPCG
jgi:hypothetical protein